MVFALKFNKLTVKPQTGFGKKLILREMVQHPYCIYFLKGLKMKNGQTCIQKAICLEVRKIRAKNHNNLLVKEFDHNHETRIPNAESSTYVKRST